MPSRDLAQFEKQIWREIGKIQGAMERKLMANYKMALDETRVVLSKIYEKYATGGALTYAEMSKYNRLMSLHKQLQEIMGPVFSRNGPIVDKLGTVIYEESFYRHAWAVDQNAGVALKWGLLNPATVEKAIRGQGWRDLHNIAIKTMRQDAWAKLDRTITQGMIQGESYPKLMRKIKEDVFNKSASNALRIARTEGQRAAVQGQIAQADRAEEIGVEIKRIWDATLDKRTRPEHGRLDGQAADKDGFFHTSVGLVSGPLQSGNPAFDINCRCRVREEVVGYPPEVRRIRDEGLQPYETYDTWATRKGIKSYQKYLIKELAKK